MICNHCSGTGFVNSDQFPNDVVEFDDRMAYFFEMLSHKTSPCMCGIIHEPCPACNAKYCDIAVCTCCGDGEDWYGTPGHHYGPEDPIGPDGPYANNGGLCRCH